MRSRSASEETESRLEAAKVVGGWALLIVALVLAMVAFGGPSVAFRSYLYGSGALLMALTALLVMFPVHSKQVVGGRRAPSGAPSAALGAIVLILVLAASFSAWLAVLSLPLCGFVVARAFGELRRRRSERS